MLKNVLRNIKLKTLLNISAGISTGSVLALGMIYLLPWPAIAQITELGGMVSDLAGGMETAAGGSLVKGLLMALILSQVAIVALIYTGGKYLITIAKKPETFNSDAARAMMKETLWAIYRDIKKDERAKE